MWSVVLSVNPTPNKLKTRTSAWVRSLGGERLSRREGFLLKDAEIEEKKLGV